MRSFRLLPTKNENEGKHKIFKELEVESSNKRKMEGKLKQLIWRHIENRKWREIWKTNLAANKKQKKAGNLRN